MFFKQSDRETLENMTIQMDALFEDIIRMSRQMGLIKDDVQELREQLCTKGPVVEQEPSAEYDKSHKNA